MTIRVPRLDHPRHRGDPCLKATACPPSVVADTIMRTIELGVTITDAAVDEEHNHCLGLPPSEQSQSPRGECLRATEPRTAVRPDRSGPPATSAHCHTRRWRSWMVSPLNCGFLCGAKGTRTPDPHTARVKPSVLARVRASTACRNVHVGRPFPYSCVQCVFAGYREY